MGPQIIFQKKSVERLGSIWLKAAIVGGLWASIEIILGSFLHNLRIPFAGSILTFIGISLLVSFHRMWPLGSLIIRAGIICALMKSISPSSVILGPMSGIFFEALFLQLGLRLLGSSKMGYFLGAALGMLSTLVHKIISLLILYGWDIVPIYKNLYFFLAKQIHIQDADPWLLLWLVISVYVIFGFLAALLGLSVGNKTISIEKFSKAQIGIPEKRDFFATDKNQKFRLPLLFLHILCIPLGLFLINMSSLWIAVPYFVGYILFCFFWYRNSLQRLKKPIFWFQLLMISLLAALFWGGFDFQEGLFKWEGLRVGLEMNLRAIFIVVGFSSFSVELRNPIIKNYLFNKGFGQLYQALGLAFSALPVMMRSMPKPTMFFKDPAKWFAGINLQAKNWLDYFISDQK
jgi:hypothetical protein